MAGGATAAGGTAVGVTGLQPARRCARRIRSPLRSGGSGCLQPSPATAEAGQTAIGEPRESNWGPEQPAIQDQREQPLTGKQPVSTEPAGFADRHPPGDRGGSLPGPEVMRRDA